MALDLREGSFHLISSFHSLSLFPLLSLLLTGDEEILLWRDSEENVHELSGKDIDRDNVWIFPTRKDSVRFEVFFLFFFSSSIFHFVSSTPTPLFIFLFCFCKPNIYNGSHGADLSLSVSSLAPLSSSSSVLAATSASASASTSSSFGYLSSFLPSSSSFLNGQPPQPPVNAEKALSLLTPCFRYLHDRFQGTR